MDKKIQELIAAAKSWEWHQDKYGGKYYTSVICEQDEKHQARDRLKRAIRNLD